MACEGICGICHVSRSQCQCIAGRRGGKVIDDFLPLFDTARTYILTEKFFGKDKHEIALALIGETRNEAIHTETPPMGFDRMRIDRDAKRLVAMADGKLFATRQKMAEQKDDERGKRANSTDVLERYRQRMRTSSLSEATT